MNAQILARVERALIYSRIRPIAQSFKSLRLGRLICTLRVMHVKYRTNFFFPSFDKPNNNLHTCMHFRKSSRREQDRVCANYQIYARIVCSFLFFS